MPVSVSCQNWFDGILILWSLIEVLKQRVVQVLALLQILKVAIVYHSRCRYFDLWLLLDRTSLLIRRSHLVRDSHERRLKDLWLVLLYLLLCSIRRLVLEQVQYLCLRDVALKRFVQVFLVELFIHDEIFLLAIVFILVRLV